MMLLGNYGERHSLLVIAFVRAFHLLKDLRLDVTPQRSCNLLLPLFQPDLLEPAVKVGPVIASFIVKVRLVAVEPLNWWC